MHTTVRAVARPARTDPSASETPKLDVSPLRDESAGSGVQRVRHCQALPSTWEVELLFKELESAYNLDYVPMSNLILVALILLVVSCVLLDLLREIVDRGAVDDETDDSPYVLPRRWSRVFSRYGWRRTIWKIADLPSIQALIFRHTLMIVSAGRWNGGCSCWMHQQAMILGYL